MKKIIGFTLISLALSSCGGGSSGDTSSGANPQSGTQAQQPASSGLKVRVFGSKINPNLDETFNFDRVTCYDYTAANVPSLKGYIVQYFDSTHGNGFPHLSIISRAGIPAKGTIVKNASYSLELAYSVGVTYLTDNSNMSITTTENAGKWLGKIATTNGILYTLNPVSPTDLGLRIDPGEIPIKCDCLTSFDNSNIATCPVYQDLF